MENGTFYEDSPYFPGGISFAMPVSGRFLRAQIGKKQQQQVQN